jgi:antitoxin StbD
METVLSELSVSMSEFKKNPAAVLREAGNRPVAVLSHNRPAFHMVEPALFAAMVEQLADSDLLHKIAARLPDKSRAVEVALDQL